MTPERIKFYDDYFALTASDGWKQFVAQLVEDLTGAALVSTVKTATTERELGIIQGRMELAELAISLEASIKMGHAQELEDES